MENKNNKGLVIVLVIVMLVLFAVCTLFFTGILKSPFVKETTTKVADTTTTTENTKTDDSKTEVKETRYYQYYVLTEGDKPEKDKINYCTQEVQLNPDGTAKYISTGACSGVSLEGRYIEDDSSIALFLNNEDAISCKDKSTEVDIPGGCKEAIFMIKENGKLLEAIDNIKLYKFDKEGASNVTEYNKVQKTELLSNLKN